MRPARAAARVVAARVRQRGVTTRAAHGAPPASVSAA